MSKNNVIPAFLGVFLVLAILSCATAGPADPAVGYEDIIVQIAGDIALKLPPRARVAVVDIAAEPEGLADYIAAGLTIALNGAGVETVARSSLDYVHREMGRQISGKFGNYFLGRQVDAGYIITGQFARAGSRYRLSFDLVNLGSGKTEMTVRIAIPNNGELQELLASLGEGPGIPFPSAVDIAVAAGDAARSPGLFLDLGMFFAGQNQPERAIEYLSGAVDAYPNYVMAYYWRGYIRQSRYDYEKAITDYALVSRFDPNNAALYNTLGDLYSLTGGYDDAIDAYSAAIKLEPRNGGAYNNRGSMHLFKDEIDLAVADFSQAIKIDPRDAFFYISRGEAHALNGDYDRAIADYSQTIKLDPSIAAAYRGRGKAYSDTGDTEKAIDDYTQAISLEPSFAAVYNLRGILYISPPSPDYPRAIADFAEASRLEPANQLYRRNLQVAQERQAGRR